jgi:putative MATE family efflux protein
MDGDRVSTPRNGDRAALHDARTRAILEDPPLRVLGRLAAPSALAFLVQAAVSLTEVAFVGRLGTEALAAIALVFPLFMLVNMLTAGSLGGAATAAVARALGSGDRDRAAAVAAHVLWIALTLAAAFAALHFTLGRTLLTLLGGEGDVLDAAARYGDVLFAGILAPCVTNLLAAVHRGLGDTRFPARVILTGSALQVLLSALFILGPGPFPSLGVPGAAVAAVLVASLNAVRLLHPLLRAGSALRLHPRHFRPRGTVFAAVLRVGLMASPSPLFTVLTIVSLTGLVARAGPEALAGYGIGSRVEFLLVPLVFGIGSALTIMVGTHVGAGLTERAERVAVRGALVAAALTGGIGALLALFPHSWSRLFSDDPQALATAALYLRIVGPCFAFQGLGLALYFASQGAGAVLWPVLATVARYVVAVGGGTAALALTEAGPSAVFVAAAVAMVLYGTVTAASVALGAWRGDRA